MSSLSEISFNHKHTMFTILHHDTNWNGIAVTAAAATQRFTSHLSLLLVPMQQRFQIWEIFQTKFCKRLRIMIRNSYKKKSKNYNLNWDLPNSNHFNTWKIWDLTFGFGLVLSHINHSKLLNAKSCWHIYIRYIYN